MKQKRIQIGVRLSQDLYTKVRHTLRDHEISLQDFIVEAIELCLEQKNLDGADLANVGMEDYANIISRDDEARFV